MNNISNKSTKEKKLIINFVSKLNEKNYAKANKFLQKIVETKLNKRIAKTINNL